jgi:hypothetical protein
MNLPIHPPVEFTVFGGLLPVDLWIVGQRRVIFFTP